MPLQDNVAAANKINDLLKVILSRGGFRLKYRITVNQPAAVANPSEEQGGWRNPDILVDVAGPDSGLLLERGAELLNSFEHLALKALRLEADDHDKLSFDCRNSKAVRREELKLAADVAARGANYLASRVISQIGARLHTGVVSDWKRGIAG